MKKRLLIVVACILALGLVVYMSRWKQPSLERFLQPKKYNVIIIPQTAKKSAINNIDTVHRDDTVYINQSPHVLNTPLEFLVNDDQATIEDIKGMARAILPASSEINFVVVM